jgi:hypothetical protein
MFLLRNSINMLFSCKINNYIQLSSIIITLINYLISATIIKYNDCFPQNSILHLTSIS